jgi:N-acetylmuramate 1-kinase|tara:strand:- start:467 stop:1405 length:939 start_codon:yes stop_codon:yes gene_type:complete
MKSNKNLKKLQGDASLRTFFRKKKNNLSSIVVYANKDKRLNLLIYDAINKILLKNNILAPRLLNENYSKNNIEIQDFGNQTIFDFLTKKTKNQLLIFKKIIKLLDQIQLIPQRKIEDFKKKIYKVPIYYPKILLDEAKLFTEWYVPQKLSKSKQKIFKKSFIKIIKKLIKKLYLKNNVFVHRDFHVSNLMMVNNEIGVIDSQDALVGNKTYDLASLIDDVRFKTSENIKKKIFNFYLNKKKLNKKKFQNDFEIISVLRNLKIIGIFTKLAVRDNKPKYLKLIPYAWNLIKLRSKNRDKFEELNNLLNVIKKR